LTERQVNTLKRLTRTVVLALDADAAGDEAVLRGLEVARQVYGDATVAVPLPQGLVRLESRLDADIRIASLPRGKDPDEIIRENPREWQSLVDQAKSVVDFYFDAVLRRADLSSTKGVAAAVRQLLPIIGEVRDNVQQALYLQRLAERVHIAEQLLASELVRLRLTARNGRLESTNAEPAERPKRAALDEYALGLLLLYPAQAPPFLNELDEGHWVLVESQEVFREIWRQYQSTGQVSRDAVVAALPGPIADWLRVVLEREGAHPTLDERALANEQERSLRDLRRRSRRARLPTYTALLRDSEADGDLATVADVQRKIETELAQLEADERLSKRARIWSDLA
jgi:DNA primase